MKDVTTAERARDWLEAQLTDLAQLRNANRRDPRFKAWRQNALTTIQRIWPGDVRRIDRFRRIPFSPPMSRPTEKQVREYFERGWGEAGVLLRQFLAELALVGIRPSTEESMPDLDAAALAAELQQLPREPFSLPAEFHPVPEALAVSPDAPREEAPAPPAQERREGRSRSEAPPEAEEECAEDPKERGDEIGRAMAKLFGNAPISRQRAAEGVPAPAAELQAPSLAAESREPSPAAEPGVPGPAEPRVPEPEIGTLASELLRLAADLEALGLPKKKIEPARAALRALAYTDPDVTPSWELVRQALELTTLSPVFARRALPLLLPLVASAA